MERFSDYCFYRVEGPNPYTVGEGYGTEAFCWFLYSVIRMENPQTVVEIGSGAGISTAASALALKQNARGTLWSVDDGSDWSRLRYGCQAALNYREDAESYASFRERLMAYFGVSTHVRLISETAGDGNYFAPTEPVDVLFVDAGNTRARGCVQLLRFYLPRMSPYSSIFIDGASTAWDSFLLMERLTETLNQQRIPRCLTDDINLSERVQLEALVRESKFTLVHLVDRNLTRANRLQNGRCWFQIRPCDVVADDSVPNKLYNY